MLAAMEVTGNASSVHAEGRAARQLLDDAREAIAARARRRRRPWWFSPAAAARPIIWRSRARRSSGCWFRRSSILPCSRRPRHRASRSRSFRSRLRASIDLDALEADAARLRRRWSASCWPTTRPVSSSQLREVAGIAHGAMGRSIHCDAVQALGKMPVNFGLLGVDLLTVSAHKMGGPVGRRGA